MRVAIVYLGRRGGGNQYTFYIAKAIAKIKGVRQKLFLQQNMENIDMFKRERFDIEKFETFGKGIVDAIKMPIYLFKLKKALDKFDPDVIYVTMFNPYIPFLFKLFPKVKKVFTLHGATSYGGRTRTILENRLQKKSVALSDYAIALSKHYVQWIRERFPEKKVFLLPHPLFDDYVKIGKERIVRGEYILFIGRIGETYKGFEIMQKAFEKIKSRMPLKLVIAGKGERPVDLQGDSSYVFIDKWLSDEEFVSLLRYCWVVCLPYTQPTPSGIIAGALVLKKPVIASDLSGLNEQIIHGKNGILVKAGDEEMLAKAIEQLFKSKNDYKKLRKGAAIVAKQFTAGIIAKRLGSILKEIK